MRTGNISVPMRHGDPGFLKKLLYSEKLVVYKSLERRNIQHPDARRHISAKLGKHRKKCRLGLSARRRRGQEQIVIGLKYALCRRDLDLTKRFPRVTVNIFFDKIRETVKYSVGFGHFLIFLSGQRSRSSGSNFPFSADCGGTCFPVSSSAAVLSVTCPVRSAKRTFSFW